ncbi:hypothetical protein LSH36_26g15096 [Paralvinella palmiformis]|uniref:Uncharacterized protein n=1 Tax=Paralvinella palmiformis TaxID=53620 RepID=A0AAD9KBX1_9ANNE|nr:hypothetical protein LSH36_26g15096 [Paralvinella palmiformis]
MTYTDLHQNISYQFICCFEIQFVNKYTYIYIYIYIYINNMDKDFQDDLDSTVDSYLDIDVDLLKRRQKIVDNEKSLYEYKMERKAHGKKRTALVHRVVIISKTANTDFDEVGGKCFDLLLMAHNLDEYEPSEESFRLVIDMLIQLLKLGAYLNKQPKVALKNVMENLLDKVPELLPQQDVINFLIEKDAEATVTPQEHLNRYQKPFDVTLDSELTWPMPVRLFPYN